MKKISIIILKYKIEIEIIEIFLKIKNCINFASNLQSILFKNNITSPIIFFNLK